VNLVRICGPVAIVLGLGLIGSAGPAVSVADMPSLEQVGAHVLAIEDVRTSGNASVGIRPFVNENLPDTCTQSVPGQIVCDRSYAVSTWPTTSQYPYWLRVHVFATIGQSEAQFSNLTYYRPLQEDVVATLRDESDGMTLSFSHSWGDDTSWAATMKGRYIVESTCSSGRLALDHRLLGDCAEGVVAEQMGRLTQNLGPAFFTPGPPVGVSAAWDGSVVRVTWLPPNEDGGLAVERYVVQRASGQDVCEVPPTSTGFSSCEVSDLDDGDDPSFVVFAENPVGRGESSLASNRVAIQRVLAAPRNLRAKVRGNTIRVTWRKIPPGATDGRVRYTVTSSPGGKECRTRKTRCVFRDLDPGRDYIFQIVASDRSIQSAPVVSDGIAILEPAPASRPESGSDPVSPPSTDPKPEQQFS